MKVLNQTRRGMFGLIPASLTVAAVPASAAIQAHSNLDAQIKYHIEQIKLLSMKRDRTISDWMVTHTGPRNSSPGTLILLPVRIKCPFTGNGTYRLGCHGKCKVVATDAVINGRRLYSVMPLNPRDGSRGQTIMMEEHVLFDGLLERIS